jgi:8-oxo-dGTP diphosphatase
MSRAPIHVIAGVLRDAQGRVLLAQRVAGAHLAGLWEFPGGKIEPGETREAALARELDEELGVTVVSAAPLIRVRHDYPDKSVSLDVWEVDDFSGVPHGREGQPIAWVPVTQLHRYPMPAADAPVVVALRLPSTYVITPEPSAGQLPAFVDELGEVLARGARLLQLRAKSLEPSAFASLAQAAAALCAPYGAQLMLNDAVELARGLGSVGVQLSGQALWAHKVRPLAPQQWVAASCHDVEDLQQAVRIGADFALLSPVMPTPSHPDAAPLGWQRFAAMVEQAALPVFALGGMTAGDVQRARACGAQGVAGISGFWFRPR